MSYDKCINRRRICCESTSSIIVFHEKNKTPCKQKAQGKLHELFFSIQLSILWIKFSVHLMIDLLTRTTILFDV